MRGALIASGIIPVLILLAAGYAIKFRKAYWLISGYNTMPEEKKKNVDVEGIGSLAANMCFVIAGIILVGFALMYANIAPLSLLVFALLIPVIIYTLVKAQKYDGNSRDCNGRMKTGTKAMIGFISGFIIMVSIGVGILAVNNGKPAEFSLNDGILKISGMYGREIPVASIKNLEIRDTIPEILTKTNGSSIGTMCKGYFKVKDLGTAILFADTSIKPFIYLDGDFQTIILNYGDSVKTRELFDRLQKEWLQKGGAAGKQ